MAHITIPDQNPVLQYSVGGSPQDTFIISFVFFEADGSDVRVYNGDDLINPGDYTITGTPGTEGGFDGGTLVLNSAVTNTIITAQRNMTIDREEDFPNSGPFNIQTLNTTLDKWSAVAQQLRAQLSYSIKLPPTTNKSEILFPDFQPSDAHRVVIINSIGSGITLGPTTQNLSALAAIASQISAVAGMQTQILSLYGMSTEILTVYSHRTDIQAVAAIAPGLAAIIANQTNINTVAGNLTGTNTIGTVATYIANVNSVSAGIASVISVASNLNGTNTIGTVAANLSGTNTIGAVAANQTNINAVAGNASNITAVAGNASNINTVASNLNGSNTIGAVVTNQSNINAVAANATNINSVAANGSQIGTVAGNLNGTNTIGAVASNQANINAVAGNAANINNVASNKDNIDAVADDLTGANNIGAVLSNLTNINAVAGNEANIDAVAANAANINTVAADLTGDNNIGTVAGEIDDVTLVAENFDQLSDLLKPIEQILEDFAELDGGSSGLPINGPSGYEWQATDPLPSGVTMTQSIEHTVLDYSYKITNASAEYADISMVNNFEPGFERIAVDIYAEGDLQFARLGCGWASITLTPGQHTIILHKDEVGGEFNYAGMSFILWNSSVPVNPPTLYVSNIRALKGVPLEMVAENSGNINSVAEWIDDGMPAGTPQAAPYSFLGNPTASTDTAVSMDSAEAKWLLGMPSYTTPNRMVRYYDGYGNTMESQLVMTAVGRMTNWWSYYFGVNGDIDLDPSVYPPGSVLRLQQSSDVPITITIPFSGLQAGEHYRLIQMGTADVTIAYGGTPGGGVHNIHGHTKMAGQYSVCELECYAQPMPGQTHWVFHGQTKA